MRKRLILVLVAVWVAVLLAGCSGGAGEDTVSPTSDITSSVTGESPQPETVESPQTDTENPQETDEKEQASMKMNVKIGKKTFAATLEDNQAVEELVEMIKEEGSVTLWLDDYGGFEKVGPLGRSLTTSNSQTTTQAGDIVLYNGNQIVMFYGSNSWSYTRLAKIDDLTGWSDAIGRGISSVSVTFRLDKVQLDED